MGSGRKGILTLTLRGEAAGKNESGREERRTGGDIKEVIASERARARAEGGGEEKGDFMARARGGGREQTVLYRILLLGLLAYVGWLPKA